jgi:hypothetical protein
VTSGTAGQPRNAEVARGRQRTATGREPREVPAGHAGRRSQRSATSTSPRSPYGEAWIAVLREVMEHHASQASPRPEEPPSEIRRRSSSERPSGGDHWDREQLLHRAASGAAGSQRGADHRDRVQVPRLAAHQAAATQRRAVWRRDRAIDCPAIPRGQPWAPRWKRAPGRPGAQPGTRGPSQTPRQVPGWRRGAAR